MPKPGKKRTLSELRADDDLSPASKKRKICETAVNVMEQMKTLCVAKGESIGSVLGECCLLTKKVGSDARELFEGLNGVNCLAYNDVFLVS